jgi:hemolysin III
MEISSPTLRVKPRLRGVSHQFASFVALLGGVILVLCARTPRAALAASVYAASLVVLFSVSALYHVPTWTPRARQRMRRLDHASIFLLIAGTYTPVCVLGLPPEAGDRLLMMVWGAAGLGVLQTILWVQAPKPLAAALYVLMGWLLLPYAGAVWHSLGAAGVGLIGLGGLFYTAGAVIYAVRRPDPLPTVFGYHEIFHVLVILASVCHFIAVTSLVMGAPFAAGAS